MSDTNLTGTNEMKSEDTDSAKRTVVTDEVKGCCLRNKEKVEAVGVSALILFSLQD